MSGNIEDNEEVKFYSKNLVGIGARQTYGDPPKTKSIFIPGIILSVQDIWFFITAGHWFGELEKAAKWSKIDQFRLIDYFGPDTRDKTPYPFDYHGTIKDAFNEPNGVDFGFIFIRTHYRRLMEKNGVRAHDKVQWTRQPDKFIDAFMLGLPASYVREEPSQTLFKSALIPLKILDKMPEKFAEKTSRPLTEDEERTRESLFYAEIPKHYILPKNEDGKDDIVGMSGGPIIGFGYSLEKLKYWVAAIQCAWFPDSRLIQGCPLPLIGFYMEKIVQSVLERYEQSKREQEANEGLIDPP